MIEPSKKLEYLTVTAFIAPDGKEVDNIDDCTVIMTAIDDGLGSPFAKSELGDDVKIGDRFARQVRMWPIEKEPFSVQEVIEGLLTCLENGSTEDSIGLLFDLLNHVAPDYNFMDALGIVALKNRYGNNPTPIDKEKYGE